jgi:SLOG family YspA-like protein
VAVPRRVLICGDRAWNDYFMLANAVWSLPDGSIIIEGEANGADQLARKAAECREPAFRVMQFPAQWWKYGRGAGPVRNRQMLKEGQPDEVWAFHDNLAASKGTANMVRLAERAGLPVRKFSHARATK